MQEYLYFQTVDLRKAIDDNVFYYSYSYTLDLEKVFDVRFVKYS